MSSDYTQPKIDSVPVNGVWVRKMLGEIQILVEIKRQWHLLFSGPPANIGSWIIEARAFESKPLDPVIKQTGKTNGTDQ